MVRRMGELSHVMAVVCKTSFFFPGNGQSNVDILQLGQNNASAQTNVAVQRPNVGDAQIRGAPPPPAYSAANTVNSLGTVMNGNAGATLMQNLPGAAQQMAYIDP